MQINVQPIEGLYMVELNPFVDSRGSFSRIFCSNELKNVMNNENIVQINISKNNQKGLIRGIHYQKKPNAEMKLINCIKGKIYDVVVDLRINSKTFLQWRSYELSQDDNKLLIIPKGCAHGFQTLAENSNLLYFSSEFYSADNEGGINYNDPLINIKWPLPIGEVSNRDKEFKFLNNNFKGI
jgi:dTDP-4-dehydrorhamnose 3,5-epimerase